MTNGEKLDQVFPDGICPFSKNWLDYEYKEPTTKNDLVVDCVARKDIERYIEGFINEYTPKEELEFINLELDGLKHIPTVTPQEPRCKECKWWKDSDGEYRRGCGAESQCPINRKEVFEGNGYCFLFEPQESEG